MLEIHNLSVSVENKEVLKNLSLTINAGELHAVMGRNGSGKTSLSHVLMGHPKYTLNSGSIIFQGQDITGLAPEERASLGMFLCFQYPVSIPGVTVANFLRSSLRAVRKDLDPKDFRKKIKEEIKNLGIPETFMSRFLNCGFSGGEKKRLEILQMRLLQPKFGILDETDSGLDIDALRIVSENIENSRTPERGFLVITHYQRMLNHIKPDFVHVLMNGSIIKSGGPGLALELESKGYDWVGHTA